MKITNAMTVDVEDYFHVAALSASIDRVDWDGMLSRVEKNTEVLLENFESASITATFFVLGWVAERYPGLIRKICAAGHELACHGYSHELIYKQSRQLFESETKTAKSILEDISGEPVRGYRAASYSITERSLWALEVLVEAGFEYDSSIVPAKHDFYGIPGANEYPYEIVFPDGSTLVEFPPSTIQIMSSRIPIGGGGYFRIFPYWFSKWGLGKLNNVEKMPFSFYLHPWEIDPDQPRIPASLKSRFRHYTNLDRCLSRLVKLESDFEFSTMVSVLESVERPSVPYRELAASDSGSHGS